MQLGMIGAGRMGANMARRLARDGHSVVMFDVAPDTLEPLAAEGFETHGDLAGFVGSLEQPRTIWMMIPAAYVGQTVDDLSAFTAAGDVIVDGGNSWYREAIDRASRLGEDGVFYLDCGTSGGVLGLERGYCLMIGGAPDPVARLDPVFRSLAPGVESAPRTAGRSGPIMPAEEGYLHCGPPGSGHFTKMVHNGIEYAIMAAYAEGLNVLRHAGVGDETRAVDAETTPLRDPEAYKYDLPVDDVAEVWRRGSVIGSWLLDLTASALLRDPQLDSYSGSVSDSGEGRWTLQAAIDMGVPTPALSAALFSRFESRGEGRFAAKVLSAMREEFGGHAERLSEGSGE